jgi:hypothetical protein
MSAYDDGTALCATDYNRLTRLACSITKQRDPEGLTKKQELGRHHENRWRQQHGNLH